MPPRVTFGAKRSTNVSTSGYFSRTRTSGSAATPGYCEPARAGVNGATPDPAQPSPNSVRALAVVAAASASHGQALDRRQLLQGLDA